MAAEHWTKADLSQTHAIGHWEDQGRTCKTYPMWNVHPVHKLVGWCPSSLCKATTICFLILSGPWKACPVVCFSICSSAQALKLPWSSSLRLLLVTPFSRDASLAPVLHLPSKEPPLFQDQDPMKVGKWFTRPKARPSQSSRGEVSGTHPGMSLFRDARRSPGIYFSKHKHTEIQEGRLGGSSVGCREQHTLACWLRVSWALWWFTTNVLLPHMPWYLSLGGLHEQPWGLHFAPKTFLRSVKVISCLALLKFSPGHIFFLSYPLVQSPKLLALFISPILDLGLAFVFNIESTSVFGLWPFTAVSPPFVGKAF